MQMRLKQLHSLHKQLKSDYAQVPPADTSDATIHVKYQMLQKVQPIDTGVEIDSLRAINEGLLSWPEGFNVYIERKFLSAVKMLLKRTVKLNGHLLNR